MKITDNTNINRLGYIKEFDGLRAFAVFFVMLLHAHFQFGKNRSIGVDIFFALSGFLITTLLLEEYTLNNKINLKAFYIRRTFRLFPALYIMLIFIFLYSVFFTQNYSRYNILKEIFASSLYIYNIVFFWINHNFTEGFLSHTWSLAVEEQFYLFWPLLLIIFLKYFNKKKLIYFLITIIFILLILRTLNHLIIITSIFQESLFLGCLLAILRYIGILHSKMISNNLFISCFIFLVINAIFPIRFYQYLFNIGLRSFFGLLSLIIILGLTDKRDNFVVKLLNSKIIVYLGKISYGIYLWHIPVFRIFSLHLRYLPNYLHISLKFILTILIASISMIVIEKKYNKIGKNISDKILLKNIDKIFKN